MDDGSAAGVKVIGAFLRSFGYAFAGLRHAIKQRNLRFQLFVGAAVIAVSAWLRVDRRDWAILLLAIGVVLAAEVFNTAIEAVVDLLSPEKRESARLAKDTAAGAVLVLSIVVAAIGFLILGPPLFHKLFG